MILLSTTYRHGTADGKSILSLKTIDSTML